MSKWGDICNVPQSTRHLMNNLLPFYSKATLSAGQWGPSLLCKWCYDLRSSSQNFVSFKGEKTWCNLTFINKCMAPVTTDSRSKVGFRQALKCFTRKRLSLFLPSAFQYQFHLQTPEGSPSSSGLTPQASAKWAQLPGTHHTALTV